MIRIMFSNGLYMSMFYNGELKVTKSTCKFCSDFLASKAFGLLSYGHLDRKLKHSKMLCKITKPTVIFVP